MSTPEPIEHPEVSSPLSEHATKMEDPEAPTDANPPDGPHIQEVRGDASVVVDPGKAKAAPAAKAKDE